MKHLPKIFIVDDDPEILQSLEELLIPHGYDVRCFTSVHEFMAQHHPIQVGCVLIDLLMPGMSGTELLQCLQDSGSLLSVIIISGLIKPAALDMRGQESVSLLEKPYEVSTLLTMIADGVSGSFRRRAERHLGGRLD